MNDLFSFSLVLLNLHTQIRAKYQERMGFSPVLVLSFFDLFAVLQKWELSAEASPLSSFQDLNRLFIIDYATCII